MTEKMQWEYRVELFGGILTVPKDQEFQEALNDWGEEGWEVISAHNVEGTNKVRVIAKRPLTVAARRERSRP